MKKIKKFFAILLILAIGIAVINSQTDFFLNFGSYVPYLKENCPEVTESVFGIVRTAFEGDGLYSYTVRAYGNDKTGGFTY